MMTVMDGPALTLDGRVLELDGGFASYFSHDKESSPSHAAKSAAIMDFHMHQALHVAHEACDAEARIAAAESCCVDTDGILHGDMPVAPDDKKASAQKMKLFHEKRCARNRQSVQGERKLSVDSTGQVHLLDGGAVPKGADECQCIIDSDGVVHADGTSASLSPTHKCASPESLKTLHRKRTSRSRSSTEEGLMISIDSAGIVQDCWQPDITPLIMPAAVVSPR